MQSSGSRRRRGASWRRRSLRNRYLESYRRRQRRRRLWRVDAGERGEPTQSCPAPGNFAARAHDQNRTINTWHVPHSRTDKTDRRCVHARSVGSGAHKHDVRALLRSRKTTFLLQNVRARFPISILLIRTHYERLTNTRLYVSHNIKSVHPIRQHVDSIDVM